MKDKEVEIKLPLENPKQVKDFLNQNAKPASKDSYQKDTYYVPAHRDFLAFEYPFEWLRIRESKQGNFLYIQAFFSKERQKNKLL